MKKGKDGECTVISLYRQVQASCALDCVNSCMGKCDQGGNDEVASQVDCLDVCTSDCMSACAEDK